MRPRRPCFPVRTTFATLAFVLASGLPSGVARSQPPKGAAPRGGEGVPVDVLFERVGRADAARDDTALASATRALFARMPSHPVALFLAARARARLGDSTGALGLLEQLAALGDTRPVEEMSEFAGLRAMPRFRRVAARLEQNRRPVSAGETVLTLPDADFLPESVLRDSVTGDFYVGSLTRRMLVRMTHGGDGTPRLDTLAGPSDGLLRVVGIELDRTRDRLWFATWSPPVDTASSAARRVVHTRLFAYDRASRRLRRFDLSDSLHGHLLNDIIVAPNGDVYVTDTAEGTVWRVAAGADTLERFTRPDPVRLHGANGITLAPDGRRLYVAFTAGIVAVDLRTRDVRYLDTPRDVTTAGVDGLYWHRGSLVAIQGLGTDERVVRFTLDRAGTRVVGARVLERGAAIFKRPTTGTLVGDDLYYIPDAQYDRLGWDGRLAARSDATPSTIRRLPLRVP